MLHPAAGVWPSAVTPGDQSVTRITPSAASSRPTRWMTRIRSPRTNRASRTVIPGYSAVITTAMPNSQPPAGCGLCRGPRRQTRRPKSAGSERPARQTAQDLPHPRTKVLTIRTPTKNHPAAPASRHPGLVNHRGHRGPMAIRSLTPASLRSHRPHQSHSGHQPAHHQRRQRVRHSTTEGVNGRVLNGAIEYARGTQWRHCCGRGASR
jgi:hypothetical protein